MGNILMQPKSNKNFSQSKENINKWFNILKIEYLLYLKRLFLKKHTKLERKKKEKRNVHKLQRMQKIAQK